MKKTLKRSTYKLNKNRKLIKESFKRKKNKYKRSRIIKKKRNKKRNKKKSFKKSQKGGFIQLPFMNNSEGVLVNAMCNQLDENELVNNPRKVDGFVNSLCHNKKKLSGGAESNEGGVLGMVKNITSIATSPLRTIMSVVTGGSKQPVQQVTMQPAPQVNMKPAQPVIIHQTSPVTTQIKKVIKGSIQKAGSVKKKKIKLPKL